MYTATDVKRLSGLLANLKRRLAKAETTEKQTDLRRRIIALDRLLRQLN
jgi:hypothetical protein